jgi:hypothetical protein
MTMRGPIRNEVRTVTRRFVGVPTEPVCSEMKLDEIEVWLARGQSLLNSPCEKARGVTVAHEHIGAWRRQFSRSRRKVESDRNIAS